MYLCSRSDSEGLPHSSRFRSFIEQFYFSEFFCACELTTKHFSTMKRYSGLRACSRLCGEGQGRVVDSFIPGLDEEKLQRMARDTWLEQHRRSPASQAADPPDFTVSGDGGVERCSFIAFLFHNISAFSCQLILLDILLEMLCYPQSSSV